MRQISENTCKHRLWVCRAFEAPWAFLCTWLYTAQPIWTLQVLSPQVHLSASEGMSRNLKSAFDWPGALLYNPNCSPLPHPIPTGSFPTQGWLSSKICPCHRMYTWTHTPNFLLNPMIGVGFLCDDDKFTKIYITGQLTDDSTPQKNLRQHFKATIIYHIQLNYLDFSNLKKA